MKRLLLLALACLAAASLPACARDQECSPRVREGWIRLLPGGMPMHAGFGRIENPCPVPVVVSGAGSPAYGSVALHESRVVDGINRMRAIPELRIAPGGVAELKPGGLHLMLMEPRVPMKEGSRVAIEFTLQDGRVVRGEFVARKPMP